MRPLLPAAALLLFALLGGKGCIRASPSPAPTPGAERASPPVRPDHVNPQTNSYLAWTGEDGSDVYFPGTVQGGTRTLTGSDGKRYTLTSEAGDLDPCLPDLLRDAGATLPLYTLTGEDGGNVCAAQGYFTQRPGACSADAGPKYLGKAVVSPGRWTPQGQFTLTAEDGGPAFSVSCTSGAVGICQHWGYLPTATWDGGPDLGRLYQACVRAARAEYGGSGKSFTCPGTYVDFVDGVGIQTQDPDYPNKHKQSLRFESAWDERGAVLFGVTDGGLRCVRSRYGNVNPERLRDDLKQRSPGPFTVSDDCQLPGPTDGGLAAYFDGGVPFLLLTQSWSNRSCQDQAGPDSDMGCPVCQARKHHDFGPVTCDGGCFPDRHP
ncbi:ADYC domain-containing protein [Corallococcus exiguus]|uniref:ADYC domain-containing protein n=1 Tax=Corallococcus exiguus TaxID=83462 RepID=UPI001493F4FA|nr:ADYC domain-containing protein [Corallococcus exiguus]NPD26874.1 hypothetical protein [Corallococcus exiguus]NRD47645.1 hypothetical protein [Corallococcus exiguus]